MNKSTKVHKNESLSAHANYVSFADVALDETKKRDVSVGFSQWIRALLQNWRQGTVGCKGRSDVNRTNKKPFKQKGTGRARAGSARSPLWRGGGVVFGPQARVRTLKVSQQTKRTVLQSLMTEYVRNNKVAYLDWQVMNDTPKTSAAYAALKGISLHEHKVLMLLTTDDVASYASFINIPNVRIVFFDQINAFDIAQCDSIVFLKKDMSQFKDMVAQWN